MLKISTFHLLLLALLYIAVLSQDDESPEDLTEAPSEEDPVTPLSTFDSSDDDDMSATDSSDDDNDSDDDMTTGIPAMMDDDDGADGADEADDAVPESAEDPEADGGDDDNDAADDESVEVTEEPSMGSTEVDDDMEDGSEESADISDDDTTTTADAGMDAIAELGSAEEIDIDDGVASDRKNDMGAITGNAAEDANSNPGTMNGVWAAIGSVIGLIAILVGCGLVYSYRKGKWDGTQAAMNKVVALQLTEVAIVGNEDAKLNEEAPASKYDSVHQDDLISSDDGKDQGEEIDFLDGDSKTEAMVIID